MIRSRLWTKGEIKALRETYPHGTLEEITDALPHRSYDAITVKASRIGVHREKIPLTLRQRINVDPLVNLYGPDGRRITLPEETSP